MNFIAKCICACVGHNFNNVQAKYHLRVGSWGNVDLAQSVCSRCGFVRTHAELTGNFLHNNLVSYAEKTNTFCDCGTLVVPPALEETKGTLKPTTKSRKTTKKVTTSEEK